MAKAIDDLLAAMRNNPKAVRFSDSRGVTWARAGAMSDHYTHRVSWSAEDAEFVGLCTEFPGLSVLAPDRMAAFTGIEALVRDVIDDMKANGETVPEPIADRSFSGRFQARVPPELHRRLVMEAQEAGVSLNRLVGLKLATATIDLPE